MVSYDAFLPRVLIDAYGCPEIVATQAIRDAVIEFCSRSNFIQRDHDPITVVTGISDYDLEPPAGQLVVKILKCWFKMTELSPIAPDFVNSPAFYNSSIPDNAPSISTPLSFTQKDERTFSIYPSSKDTVANGLTLRISLKPTRSSTTCEDSIFEDYAETIAHGALARLLVSPGKAYMNVAAAGMHGAAFNTGINDARQRASRGHVRSGMQVRMRKI
jgi:hypothetical protein